MKSYAAATSSALVTAVGLNRMASVSQIRKFSRQRWFTPVLRLFDTLQKFPPVVGRLVPFVSIAAANAVNLPLSRQK